MSRRDDDDDFETTADGHRVLKDGRTMRVSFNDAVRARAVSPLRFADGRTDAPLGSRPGFIVSAAAERIRDEAYQRSKQELVDAWRPAQRPAAAPAAPPDPRQPISFGDSQRIRDTAYGEMCRELANPGGRHERP
jgi:hypothetical protein